MTAIELMPPAIAEMPAVEVPMPATAPADPEAGMTDKQKVAFRTFKELYRRAFAHREGERFDDDVFDKDYGICDNIANSVPHENLPSLMSRSEWRDAVCKVKDNIICQTPSFSGSYSYPVPHPDYLNEVDSATRRRKAEYAWDEGSNRWGGAYGLARLNQLGEMIDIIKNNWSDKFMSYMTPAQRNGIDKTSIVTIEGYDGLWKLYRDDESSDPYFQPLGVDGDEKVKHFSLSYVTKVKVDEKTETLTVSGFLDRHEELLIEQQAAEDEINRIKQMLSSAQAVLTNVKGKIALNDYHLAAQHKVRRL